VNFFVDNIYNLILLVLMLASGAALALPGLLRRGEKVTTLQATQLINQGKSVLLDVRDNAAFIVVCDSGLQSARATGILRAAGFTSVVSLSGGLSAWQAQGLPVAR
jgi:rhodanese-related sulfurtransferase